VSIHPRTVVAKSAALVFLYEAVALGFGPALKRRRNIDVPPLSDFAIRHPVGAGVLVGVLAYHLHAHYVYKNGSINNVQSR
jgi:uncharacterized protein YjeT (DUF2065 family)